MDLQTTEKTGSGITNTNLTSYARECCSLAREMIESNQLDRARSALEDWCGGIGGRPIGCDRLDEPTRAELLLRIGVLTAWVGSTGQIVGVLEKAKDLISESGRIFTDLSLTEKVAETQVELGHIYWQAGEHEEARVTLHDALARLGEQNRELKAITLLRIATVEITSQRLNDAKARLIEAAPLFEELPQNKAGHALKGRFHNTLAVVYKKLFEIEGREDYKDLALVEYSAAGYHFEQAGSIGFQGYVENNLASLLSTCGRHSQALKHVEQARDLFQQLGVPGRIAEVDDTKARILLAMGPKKIFKAACVSRRAISVLENGDEMLLLSEALITYGRIQARLGRFDRALDQFHRAGDVALKAGNREAAGGAHLALIEELGNKMNPVELILAYEGADALLRDSRIPTTLMRLRTCAQQLSAAAQKLTNGATGYEVVIHAEKGCDLKAEVLRYEGSLIKRAWDVSGGVLNKTARLLGMSHQKLSLILQRRHKGLLTMKKRPQSLIQTPLPQRDEDKTTSAVAR